MRVRIDIRRCAMCCPAGMPDARMTLKADAPAELLIQQFLQILDLPDLFANVDPAVAHQCNARGVISSVFQTFQTV